MIEENEVKSRTVWSKFLHHERGEGIFAETWFAGVFCVREVSGYAVWYRRWLKNETSEIGVSNGDYLLRFYAAGARDEAIEFAVLTATNRVDNHIEAIKALDATAAESCRIEGHSNSPF
jgi:hypothetical protein